jgi:hypothetical protein
MEHPPPLLVDGLVEAPLAEPLVLEVPLGLAAPLALEAPLVALAPLDALPASGGVVNVQ